VKGIEPGNVFVLRDSLEKDASALLRVFDPDLSLDLPQPYFFAARLVPGDPGLPSYTHLEFPAQEHRDVRDRLPAVLDDLDEPAERVRYVGDRLFDGWVFRLLTPSVDTVDDPYGEPMLLTTDRYEVRDWDRLAAALESQPDVEGDREEGWVRLAEQGDGIARPRVNINLGEDDHVEVFAVTAARAEDGARWFQSLAGDTVRYLERHVQDPLSLWLDDPEPGSKPLPESMRGIPFELPTEFTQQQLHRLYRDWADQPLPLLKGKTPRECLQTESGRQAVIDCLLEYEDCDMAPEGEEAGAARFEFLWRELGLDREEYA
jgi:hypothetical protein